MRVIADHLTAAVWLVSQGLVPGNQQQSYVLRRLIRRTIRFAFDLGIEQNFLGSVVPVVACIYAASYPEILASQKETLNILAREEKAFRQTLRKGLRQFERLSDDGLTGEEIFTLYDTYGFPVELSVEEAKKRKIKVAKDWQEEFDKHMQKQRERSKTATKGAFKGGLADEGEMTTKYHTLAHLVLAAMKQVLGDSVDQKGSNITPERMRFDFSWGEKLTPEQIEQIEKLVNGWIKDDLPVTFDDYDTDYALYELKAHGTFREKYGDRVTVYAIGDISNEICGGPHMEGTGVLAEGGKTFKIVKEQSSSAGVRRIKAVLQ
jgi:alanyl-tRNA synthetase